MHCKADVRKIFVGEIIMLHQIENFFFVKGGAVFAEEKTSLKTGRRGAGRRIYSPHLNIRKQPPQCCRGGRG